MSIQMDKANQPAPVNVMVSSLTASFGQLEVDSTCTGDGPINKLPNEMIQMIMAKLALDGDVKKVIRLRLVSSRWRAVVEDYCRLNKCLFVHFSGEPVPWQKDYLQSFKKDFFRFENFHNFTCLHLYTKMPSECLSFLLKMYPSIEKLSIDCSYFYYYLSVDGRSHERTLKDSLQVYINSLDSLKVLGLNGLSASPLSPALAKLEQFSYNPFIRQDDDDKLISHLAPNCARASFAQNFTCDQVLQWPNINPAWLGNLTHLRVHITRGTGIEYGRVVHLLSVHAILLQHLHLNGNLHLSPAVLEHFGKLAHLTYLKLSYTKMSFSELAQSAGQLTSLTSVLTFKLWALIDGGELLNDSASGHQFTRVLSAIFPNVAKLDLTFQVSNTTGRNESAMVHAMQQHLARFSKLHKHKINFNLT